MIPVGHLLPLLGVATWPDRITFAISAVIVLAGAIGVVVARNPVHAALMLVMTLFGIAVLFIEQQANFLAAVQVIVYAGAIVVLFLFVIMFLGVDKRENVDEEPLRGQRPLAFVLVVLALAGLLALGFVAKWSVGAHSVVGKAQNQPGGDVAALGRAVFTTYLFPFEITSALLVIAVVGAVVLVRRPSPRPGEEDGADDVDGGDADDAYGLPDPIDDAAAPVAAGPLAGGRDGRDGGAERTAPAAGDGVPDSEEVAP